MADSTDDRCGRESGEPAHQAVAVTPEARADAAWQDYISHIAEECTDTCRTVGINCPKARELKAAWTAASRAA
ncbi:hypothetical protein [Streptomyces sp. NPDC058155]|uniref:hypothetical protein n=1 Tax=Streptomyces sp. NPDC058155 TaxID=3346359 RepID=UPI0036E9DF91